jgi:hypothetical protein
VVVGGHAAFQLAMLPRGYCRQPHPARWVDWSGGLCQAREYAAREARLLQLEHAAVQRLQREQEEAAKALAAHRRNAEEASRAQASLIRTNFQRAQVMLKATLAAQQGFVKEQVGELKEGTVASRHLKVTWARLPSVRQRPPA